MSDRFKPYGGLNMVFAGDLCQLQPVGKEPIFKTVCPEFQDAVNCYIELKGMHRFSKDREWGLLLRRIRQGKATVEDIRRINRECLIRNKSEIKPNVQVATPNNKERDSINTAAFEEWCKTHKQTGTGDSTVPGAVMIFMDELKAKNSQDVFLCLL